MVSEYSQGNHFINAEYRLLPPMKLLFRAKCAVFTHQGLHAAILAQAVANRLCLVIGHWHGI